MKLTLMHLTQQCVLLLACSMLACSDDNTTPKVDKNSITQPYYMQFDLIDLQTGDSTRITRQYKFKPTCYLNSIDSNHTQIELLINNVVLYDNPIDAEFPGFRVFVNFFKTVAVPLDSMKKAYALPYRDSIASMFNVGNYTYSIRDTTYYHYSDGVEIRCDEHNSAGGTNKTTVDNSKSSFTVTNIQPLDSAKDGFLLAIKGAFTCKTIDGAGKTFLLKNGKFSSVVVKPTQPL